MSFEQPGAPAEASPTSGTETEPTTTAPAAEEGSTPAVSSAVDEGANEPGNLLDVVKAAVQPEPEAAASPTAGNEEDAAKAEVKADEAATEPKDDADLPFHNHPRWKEVIAENQRLREPAEQYGQITAFMDEAGLVPQDVAEGFDIMAKLKSGDPELLRSALEWLEPRVSALKEQLGASLPADIQEKVDTGQIDEDAANELAQARAAAALREDQLKQREARDTKAETARRNAEAGTAMVSAVDGWETRIKATDPDYPKKAALVETTCRAIVQETGKAPATPAEAIELADKALARVNAQLEAALPKPRSVTPTPRSSSATTVAQPKTLREAIQGALNAP